MKLKTLIIASSVAIAAATSANAADVVSYDPAPAMAVPMFSWQGFYAGGQIGYSWSDTSINGRDRALGSRAHFSPDPSGFIGGIYGGYNFDLGNNLVLGAETDIIWNNKDDSDHAVSNGVGMSGKSDEKWAGATRARIGFAADRFLPYAAAGIAYSKQETKLSANKAAVGGNPAVSHVSTSSDTLVGWTLGAGVDYAFTDNVILRAEYRYSDFGKETYKAGDMSYKVDHNTNDVRVGVAYKF